MSAPDDQPSTGTPSASGPSTVHTAASAPPASRLVLPDLRTAAVTAATAIAALVTLVTLVYFSDRLFQLIHTERPFDVPGWMRVLTTTAAWASALAVLALSRRHRTSGGDLASMFSAATPADQGRLTPTERTNLRHSTMAVAVLLGSTLVLALTR